MAARPTHASHGARVGGIAAGIYLLITRGEWIVLIAGVVGLIATAVYARENER